MTDPLPISPEMTGPQGDMSCNQDKTSLVHSRDAKYASDLTFTRQ